ncbi:MAG: hypothetical protein OXF88_09285 [Rhodobacteraceae bacterium]|nr:hypothetical protein [Paracoccaceae bacterium]
MNRPDVVIIRATSSDQRGNLSFEAEGAYLGAMEMAPAARNCGGIVIAQVRRVVANGSIRAHDVHVPGILVDHVVETPDMLQTTAKPYDPETSGKLIRPLDSFGMMEFGIQKVFCPPGRAGISKRVDRQQRLWRVGQCSKGVS